MRICRMNQTMEKLKKLEERLLYLVQGSVWEGFAYTRPV